MNNNFRNTVTKYVVKWKKNMGKQHPWEIHESNETKWNKWINQMQKAIYHCQYDFILKKCKTWGSKAENRISYAFPHSLIRSLSLFEIRLNYYLHETPACTWRHHVQCKVTKYKIVCLCQCLFDCNQAFSLISRCVIARTIRTCLSYVKEWDAYLS